MFGFELWEVATLVACVLGVVLVVKLAFKKDDEIEDRRRLAQQAAAELRKIHDDVLAGLLEDYAIGDYSGVVKRIREIIGTLLKPDGVIEMRAELVFAVLPELLKGDKYDTRLRRVIAQAISAHEFDLQVAGEEDTGAGVSSGTPKRPASAGTTS